ncbi:RNA methyltransferase [Ornithobacterium rhinotracheale]|uniref:RNA methyltransferase n=1 Tax=Ornithobacterium rhinotracheale TaxID=28251 RepID=UPI001FF378BE|nr:RNA methyltransferase [Ornithobacterium rhinotracheale]MCK0202862.1 RNA methyltransferase [Ornithobacterium rhinotracheale]MCK0204798.1 RNA methyltransferase [Ornithobacterium rhinotracheale]
MRKLRVDELNRLSVEDFENAPKIPLVVVLDNIRSMHNVGAVFRTGDAFVIEKLVLCGITATPPNKEIRKTAIGATESVTWEYEKETIDAVQKLKDEGYKIVCVEQVESSTDFTDFVPEKGEKYALVLGNEVSGVQQSVVDLSDICLEIPQSGTKHSLNVSVCAGIVMWQFYKYLK